MTQSGWTVQNMEILRLMSSSIGWSTRATMMSGEMPRPRSSLTECWVGLLLGSFEPEMYGTRVTWMNRQLRRPTSVAT